MQEYNVLGKVTKRKDGIARVTGQEQFSSDIYLPRMLHGRIVASPYAHARIVSVDASAAEAMGAVVITWDDVPHTCYNERIVTIPSALHRDHYVLADKVRRMGEAVAAVAAETEELAEQAARAVKVEYEVLPVLTDPVEAMQPGAAAIYDTIWHGDRRNPGGEQRRVRAHDRRGRRCERRSPRPTSSSEGTFKTPKIYHAQLEPKTAVCQPEPDGGLTLWATTQSIHNVRILLGQIFNIPLSKIDVRRIPVGGTFGSSIQMNSNLPICAALALKARRPVRLSLTREEDMNEHTKYPAQISLKLAAKKDGTLLGAEMELLADIGAHIVQAYSYLGVCIGWLVSLYRLPNIKYHGVAVYTNKVPSCAMQGFGNPQVTFAVESLMDELAEKLGLDPIDLRLKNYIGEGETFWGQGPLVKSIVRSDGVPELLHTGAEIMGMDAERNQVSGRNLVSAGEGRYRRGVGMARGFHTSERGRAAAGRCDRLLGRDGEDQPGRLDRRDHRTHGPWRRHAGGDRQAGVRGALRAAGQGEPVAGRHADHRVRRGDARDPRRVRGRRRGGQGGAGGQGRPVRDRGAVPERAARGAEPEDGREAGAGRALRALDPRQAHDDRRGRHPLLDRKLEDDRERGELPAHVVPARLRVRLPRRRGRHLDGPGADGARRRWGATAAR